MKSVCTIASSLVLAGLSTIASAQLLPVIEKPVDVQATRAIRVDRNFRPIGNWIELNQNPTPALVSMICGYDGTNVNPALMPGGAAFQDFYGPCSTTSYGLGYSWTYGPLANWPVTDNDITPNPAASHRSAQIFRTMNRWNPAGTNPASGTARCMVAVFTGHGFDPVTDIMDGWVIQFGPNTGIAGGYYRLTANFSGTNFSFPLPDVTGHTLVYIGTLDGSGAFVPLPAPGTASPGFHNVVSPGEPQFPGTNPSSSTHLTWLDNDASFGIDYNTELYTFDETASNLGIWSPSTAFFVDNDTPRISGVCTLGDLDQMATARPVKNIHVRVTAAGDPSTVIKVDNVAISLAGDYEITAPTAPGMYDLYFEVTPHWLIKAVYGVNFTGTSISGVNVTLINGDVNGDDATDIGDYGPMSTAFGTFFGDPTYDINADLNHDDAVDIGDYGILSSNYNLFGD